MLLSRNEHLFQISFIDLQCTPTTFPAHLCSQVRPSTLLQSCELNPGLDPEHTHYIPSNLLPCRPTKLLKQCGFYLQTIMKFIYLVAFFFIVKKK